MKSFLTFFSEARVTKASERAHKLGLESDGSGGWKDSSGRIVAKTIGGNLVFTNRKVPKSQNVEKDKFSKKSDNEVKISKSSNVNDRDSSSNSEEDSEGKIKTSDSLTVVFGRFNPPTTGHLKLLDKAKTVSDGDIRIYPSRSVDSKKNPLEPNEKTLIMRTIFPDHAENIINDERIRTIFDALKNADNEGYNNIKIVVGSDRASEFDTLANKYNGNLYNFDEIETISAGQRDDDSVGVEGMSASKMRKAAVENDFDTFRSGIPKNIDDKEAKKIMNTVRRSMKVTAEGFNIWEIAPSFDWRNLRENYVNGNIFKPNQIIESLNTGLVGKIIRRGTNYLICVTEDNIMFKSWISDVMEKVVNYPSAPSGVPAEKRLVGTDEHRKYVMNINGMDYIKNFINNNKKK